MHFLCYVLPRCMYKLFENEYKEQFIQSLKNSSMVAEEARAKGHLYRQCNAWSRTTVCIACEEGEGCAGQALTTVSP